MTTDVTFLPPTPRERPSMRSREVGMLTDIWLIPNGIVGWLPEGSTITVADGQITWPRWRHLDPDSGPWESDLMIASDLIPKDQRGADPDADLEPVVDEVTVPLRVPVTDEVRALFDASTVVTLVER